MESVKNISLELIGKLPDTCTIEEIMYQLNLVSQVMQGHNDAEQGKLHSTEEVLQQVRAWGK